MKVGQQVSFTVPAYPGQTFKAPIRRISRALDQIADDACGTRRSESRREVFTGKFHDRFLAPRTNLSPTLFVPTSAVTTDQQHTFVIRQRNDKAEWVTVQRDRP